MRTIEELQEIAIRLIEEESFLVNEDWVKSNCNYNIKLGGLNTGFNLFKTVVK